MLNTLIRRLIQMIFVMFGISVIVFLIFFAGSADRIYLFLNWSYATQIWIYRVLVFALPLFVFFVTRKVCRELQGIESVELARERELAGSRVAGADALSRTPG